MTRTDEAQLNSNGMPSTTSLLTYYQQNRFNPVPIILEGQPAWELHFARRRNLYERHLGIPLSLLRGRSVLEFGCNSGENALVLAAAGANLTLVEPNGQVLPRLKALFRKFDFERCIVALAQETMESFESKKLYDVVLAEGFLYTLSNRDKMVRKIGTLLAPRGLAVLSFNDRYGCLLELTRRMILWRACQLGEIDDVHSQASLDLARRMYGEDFARLKASRPFEVWWKDSLVNPFCASAYLWSYPELFPLVESIDCDFYSSSPKWVSIDHFMWYKNVLNRKNRHRSALDTWSRVFSFFLTGLPPLNEGIEAATSEVIDSVAELTAQISKYTTTLNSSIDSVLYPFVLDGYFGKSKDSRLFHFNSEMKNLYETVKCCQLDNLISAYHRTKYVRNLWGTPYHYICFSKLA